MYKLEDWSLTKTMFISVEFSCKNVHIWYLCKAERRGDNTKVKYRDKEYMGQVSLCVIIKTEYECAKVLKLKRSLRPNFTSVKIN